METNKKKIHACQVCVEGWANRWSTGSQGNEIMYDTLGGYIYICQNPKRTTVKANVKYGLCLIMMCQCWLIVGLNNECTTLQDDDGRGFVFWGTVWGQNMWE